jgi:hypothetical protein
MLISKQDPPANFPHDMLPFYPLGTVIQDHIVAVVIVPFGQEELCGVAKPISLVVQPG